MGLPFPIPRTSAVSLSGDSEYLVESHEIPHNVASNAEIYFTAKEVQEWAHDHGIHWFYLVSHNPEATGLTGFLCLFLLPLLIIFYRVYLQKHLAFSTLSCCLLP